MGMNGKAAQKGGAPKRQPTNTAEQRRRTARRVRRGEHHNTDLIATWGEGQYSFSQLARPDDDAI